MRNEKYEQIMSWVIRNVDKRLYNPTDLAYSIQELDLNNVITNQDDFVAFVKDLEKRTGRKVFETKKSVKENRSKNVVKAFFDNHYINLTVWELNFMRSVKSLNRYTKKQEACIINILNKIDKKYAKAFQETC